MKNIVNWHPQLIMYDDVECDFGKEPSHTVHVWAEKDTANPESGWKYGPVCGEPIRKYKNTVVYTIREGGIWQKWPWNWVPEEPYFSDILTDPGFRSYAAKFNVMLFSHKDGKREIKIHSMLINGKRWDCINGWEK